MLEKQGYEVKPWYELADFYSKTVELYKRQFGALQFIILVMLVLSVASTINMAIFERTGEFGTLLAIGLRRIAIFKLVLLENILLGCVGRGARRDRWGHPCRHYFRHWHSDAAATRFEYWLYRVHTRGAMGADRGRRYRHRWLPWWLPFCQGRRASRLPVVEALRHNI